MRTSFKATIAGALAGSLLIASVAPSLALPGARDAGVAERPTQGVGSTNASFRRHFYRGQSYHGVWHGRGLRTGNGLAYGGAALSAGLAGLAAGGLIDGTMAGVGSDETMDAAISYCADRFKSYDPSTGTYLGYDGYAHPCPEG